MHNNFDYRGLYRLRPSHPSHSPRTPPQSSPDRQQHSSLHAEELYLEPSTPPLLPYSLPDALFRKLLYHNRHVLRRGDYSGTSLLRLRVEDKSLAYAKTNTIPQTFGLTFI